MASYNHVTLVGNLVRDGELKYLPSGAACLDLSLAINEKWTDKKTGEKKEEVSYIDCTQFGSGADKIAEFLKKGRSVLVDGRLKQDRWEDKDGQKRSRVKVIVNRITFLSGAKKSADDAPKGGDDEVEV